MADMMDMEGTNGRRVLLCVSGCIAAYKACEVLRGLQKAGCDVKVVLTEAACEFVGPTTFEALSGHEVAVDLFDYGPSAIPHIQLSDWADLILVCPATANVVAKASQGIADDCLTSTLLPPRAPSSSHLP
jgi:phosphopantothenoylcysteine decarboxylase/phosphopantothenate--cysteine ligase